MSSDEAAEYERGGVSHKHRNAVWACEHIRTSMLTRTHDTRARAKECGYIPKECGYIPKECAYIPKECAYILEECATLLAYIAVARIETRKGVARRAMRTHDTRARGDRIMKPNG